MKKLRAQKRAGKKVNWKLHVYNGNIYSTTGGKGGLKRDDLMKNKRGKVVSKRQHANGLRQIKNLEKAGYKTQKGVFKKFSKKR